MAKAADVKAPSHLDDSFADNESWLEKFIADEDEPDRTMLWRLGSWAIAAVVALTLGLLSGQLPGGAKQTEIAGAELASQAQRLEGLARESRQETRRLAAALEILNTDRDRLFGRVTAVEQGLDSVTGSIAKQPARIIATETPPERSSAAVEATLAAPASSTATATEQPKDAAKPASPQSSSAQTATPAPQTAALPDLATKSDATTKKADRSDTARSTAPSNSATAASDSTTAPAGVNSPIASQAPNLPEVAPQNSEGSGATVVAKQASTPLMIVPPPVAPTPTAVVTAAPLAALPDDAAAANDNETPIERTQFGLDLGGASSLAGLRALWKGVRKSHGDQLGTLRPVLAVRQNKSGIGLQVHVVAGPIADAAAAARLCAILIADDRNCDTAIFDGQRLTPDVDDAKKKPAATPRPSRRKQAQRDPAPVPATAPRKPSMLSLLGVR